MSDLAVIRNLTLARAAQNIIDDIFNHPASTKWACAVQSLRIRFDSGILTRKISFPLTYFQLTLTRPLRRKLRTSLTPLRFLMRIFWKIPILALPAFIFHWDLYQDHVLSQIVL